MCKSNLMHQKSDNWLMCTKNQTLICRKKIMKEDRDFKPPGMNVYLFLPDMSSVSAALFDWGRHVVFTENHHTTAMSVITT
jgi:hypothetical protein